MEKIGRFFNSLATRLQIESFLISGVGIFFASKSYLDNVSIQGEAASQHLFNDLICQLIVVIPINILAWYAIRKQVIKPLITLTELMRDYSEGRYRLEVPYTDLKNQMGSLARKVKIFKDEVMHVQELEKEQKELKEYNDLARKNLLNNLSREFDHKVSKIVGLVNESAGAMEVTSNAMVSFADSKINLLNELQEESSKASANVNAVSETARGLANSIEQISSQVSRSSTMTKEAVKRAEHANAVILSLSEGTTRVSAVVDMISEITEQINLLALNATIEAVRAGEMGKGFVVVAGEVKNLATETARATEDIYSVISSLVSETNSAVASIKEITQTINEINIISVELSKSIAEQDLSTRKIAHNIEESAIHTNKAAANVESVSEAAQKTGESAKLMLQACAILNKHSHTLDEEVSGFVNVLKSA